MAHVPRLPIHVLHEQPYLIVHDLVDEMQHGLVSDLMDDRVRVVPGPMLRVQQQLVQRVEIYLRLRHVIVPQSDHAISGDRALILMILISVELHNMYESLFLQM